MRVRCDRFLAGADQGQEFISLGSAELGNFDIDATDPVVLGLQTIDQMPANKSAGTAYYGCFHRFLAIEQPLVSPFRLQI